MRTILQTGPAVEPVTLADAKTYARIEVNDDDNLVTGLIVSARNYAEEFTKRSLISQSWQLFFDLCDYPTKRGFIELPRGPIISITHVKAYASDDTESTMDAATYFLSGDRVALKNNSVWPSIGRNFDGLEIQFVAGYGAAVTDIPDDIATAIKMLVTHWYENREAAGSKILNERLEDMIPFGVTQILSAYQIHQL